MQSTRGFSISITCSTLTLLVLGSAPAFSEEQGAVEISPDAAVVQFVSRDYIHGVPYEGARALGTAAVPALRRYLDVEALKPRWSTVLTTIGMIGAPESYEILHSFIWGGRFSGEVDSHTFRALMAAQGAMAYAAAADTNNVLSYLVDSSDPTFWGKVAWRSGPRSPERIAELFADISTTGLALTGTARARKRLERMRDTPPTPLLGKLAAKELTKHETVRRDGLGGYLRGRNHSEH